LNYKKTPTKAIEIKPTNESEKDNKSELGEQLTISINNINKENISPMFKNINRNTNGSLNLHLTNSNNKVKNGIITT